MKIQISEAQLKSVKKLIKEENNPNMFKDNVKLSFSYYDVTKDGAEINDISPIELEIGFEIGMSRRSWGYEYISLGSIRGPEQIEVEMSYYDENENEVEDTLSLNLNWADTIIENESNNRGTIGIYSDVEVILMNSESGEIIVKEIQLKTFGID